MKLKALVAALGAALMSFGAAAASHDLSTGLFESSQNKSSNAAFNDAFDFDFGAYPGGFVSASAIEVKLFKYVDIDWDDGAALVVYDAHGGQAGGGVALLTLTDPGTTTGSFFVEDYLVNANKFSIEVRGKAIGNGMSSFAPGLRGHYDLNVLAAPVPEPETYALMLAGLAAVGFVARRRQTRG